MKRLFLMLVCAYFAAVRCYEYKFINTTNDNLLVKLDFVEEKFGNHCGNINSDFHFVLKAKTIVNKTRGGCLATNISAELENASKFAGPDRPANKSSVSLYLKILDTSNVLDPSKWFDKKTDSVFGRAGDLTFLMFNKIGRAGSETGPYIQWEEGTKMGPWDPCSRKGVTDCAPSALKN